MSKNNNHKKNDPQSGSAKLVDTLVEEAPVESQAQKDQENKTESFQKNSETKNSTMKTFIFNIQAKGGSGKTFLTALQAYKEEDSNDSLFVCLDSSTRSLIKNLLFLEGRTPRRIAEASLLDERMKIVRDKLLSTIEKLNKLEGNYERIYLDFGAPESQQFPELITRDLRPEDLKEFEKHLDAKFVFNIVVAGDTAYISCTEYMDKLVQVLGGLFEVNILANKMTFYGFNHLLEELTKYTKEMGSKVSSLKFFGDFDKGDDMVKNILANMQKGDSAKKLDFSTTLKMKNELQNI